jgi:CheY-like chemotaxis protein/GGDEF domain-containing protein
MAEAQSSILIVDDDAEDLASVEKTLASLGAEITAIKDPHEVMSNAHRHRPDVVILDALLPGLSGFDLCKQIKTDPQLKGTQVLILTGVYLRQQYRNEALQQFKADGYLTKPFRPPELQRLVVQLLSRKTRTPSSSLLRKIGLPPAPESKKRGLLGRIFGRGEAEEPTTIRIATASREGHRTKPAEQRTSAEAVEAAPVVEAPPETAPVAAPTAVAELSEVLPAPEIPKVEPPPEEAAVEVAPTAPLVEDVANPPPEGVSSEPEPPPEAAREPRPDSTSEPAAAADTDTVLVPAPAPEPPSPEPDAPPTIAVAPDEKPLEAPPEPSPSIEASETVVVQAPIEASESAPGRVLDEEPPPSTVLDAPRATDAEDVTWVVADSKTREMTLEEAAERVEAGSPEASAPEPEELKAAEPEPLPAPVLAEDVEAPREAARRPRLRLGEVPIYDEADFLAELKRELSKCKRVDRPLTLILIRVGDLGQIVELFGKGFREPVLWHIAEQAMESLREVDLVGMMSSTDRIAMTAFASDRYGGGRIVSRMRQVATKNPFRVGVELPPIIPVLDFGMATFPADGSEVEGLLHRAEEDLAAGRDRAVVPD